MVCHLKAIPIVYGASLHLIIKKNHLVQRSTMGDMKKVSYRRPTILELPVNLTVISSFLLGECKLILFYVQKKKLQ